MSSWIFYITLIYLPERGTFHVHKSVDNQNVQVIHDATLTFGCDLCVTMQ